MFKAREILIRLKKNIFLVVLLIGISAYSQNVQTNTTIYTPQELIEDILINSNCITNIVVTNVLGGDFDDLDQSYGYFNALGSAFPIKEGLVLTTGKLANVEGPNNRLSDDDAPNWNGDADLEYALNESNTTNATIIEFEFTSIANQISFNYVFASEEYQENNSSTCNYSDLFGFLIRPISETDYTNIALVPNTNTPVKVTTVHPNISNGCSAQNEDYFESWNNSIAPINFNGQTKVLTASANVIPNERYHVKLVIADEQNYRYDSAVFFEAGSFQSTVDLGEDRLETTNNPLCFNETLELDAFRTETSITYKWFKNDLELLGENNSYYTVKDTGNYSVEVTSNGACVSNGEITIEYAEAVNTNQNYLGLCDNDGDGLTFYNLHLADPYFKTDMTGLTVVDYFLTSEKADQNQDPIADSSVFFNTVPNQVVYARIENEYGCYSVESLTLETSVSSLNFDEFSTCDDDFDGYTTFNLSELRNLIQPEVSSTANITFFDSYNDAAYHQNQLPDTYENTRPNSQEIWVKAQDVFCELLTTIVLNISKKPELLESEEQLYCLNIYPKTISLNAGLINALIGDSFTFEWERDGVDLGLNQEKIDINEAGNYLVRVTSSSNCFSERTIEVSTSESATIEDIEIKDIGVESDIIITVSGAGNYEFSIDGGIYQSENIFLNVSLGNHIISVKDLDGCDTVSEEISLFGFPKFFTPNNDGENDNWNPNNMSTPNNPITNIYIFNRYGQLLLELNPNSNGWNGYVNGIEMPSTDYWYRIIFQDGQLFQGHFTLIR